MYNAFYEAETFEQFIEEIDEIKKDKNVRFLVHGDLYSLAGIGKTYSGEYECVLLGESGARTLHAGLLPLPHVPHNVFIPCGALGKDGWAVDDSQGVTLDVTLYNVPLDVNGEPILGGYVYLKEDGNTVGILPYRQYMDVKGAKKMGKIGEVSQLTGLPMTNPVEVYVGRHKYSFEEGEIEYVTSTFSGVKFATKDGEDYYIDGDEVATSYDVLNGLTEDYFICAECDEVKPCYDGITVHGGDTVCGDCIDGLYRYCEDTMAYHPIDDCEFIESEDAYYTEGYIDANFERCSSCDECIRNSDAHHFEDTGNCVCESCISDYYVRNGLVYEYEQPSIICGYHCRPRLKFYGNGPKFLGLEWELYGCGENDSAAEEIFEGREKYWFFNSDGSLNENGFEAITHPCSPEVLLEFDWEKMCQRAIDWDCEEYKGAGIHVHVSREAFKNVGAIGHLIRFFDEQYDKIIEFAKRDPRQAERWAKKLSLTPSEKRYFKKENYYKKADYSYDRYQAVNVQNQDTVEIRVFRTSTDPYHIRAIIQLVDVITDIANHERYHLTWNRIRNHANKKGYKELVSETATF